MKSGTPLLTSPSREYLKWVGNKKNKLTFMLIILYLLIIFHILWIDSCKAILIQLGTYYINCATRLAIKRKTTTLQIRTILLRAFMYIKIQIQVKMRSIFIVLYLIRLYGNFGQTFKFFHKKILKDNATSSSCWQQFKTTI